MGEYVLALVIGFALDALLGDPAWLLHPVCIIGSYISFAEKRLRARGGNLRKSALLLTVSTVLLTMAAAGALLALLSCFGRIPRLAGMALLDWLGLAMTSLAREARGVERALDRGVEAGRAQVARIVGRDTQRLSEEEIIKATVETVAENTTDGVIAPMLYAALGGPVLLWGFRRPARSIRWLATWTNGTGTSVGAARGLTICSTSFRRASPGRCCVWRRHSRGWTGKTPGA